MASSTSSNSSKDPHVILDIPNGALKVCPQYGEGRRNLCVSLSCPYLHVCRSWLGGYCRFSNCAFTHTLLCLSHNRRVIQTAGIKLLDCEENMRREVMRSFSRVCLHYNYQHCKHGFECRKMHICAWFATYGFCKLNNCQKEHRLHTQAIRILTEHGIRVPNVPSLKTADYLEIFSDVITAVNIEAYANNVGIPKCKCYERRNASSPTFTISSDGSYGTTENSGGPAGVSSSYVPPHLRGRGPPSKQRGGPVRRRIGGPDRFEAEGEQLNGASQDQDQFEMLDKLAPSSPYTTRPGLLQSTESTLEEVVAFLAERDGACDWDKFCEHFQMPVNSDPDEWLRQRLATDSKRFLAHDANVFFIKFVRYSELQLERDEKPDYSTPPDEITIFRLFRLCSDYNSHGCNSSKPNHHCNFLHLCQKFVEGSCPNERVCKLNHRLTARVFESVAAFREWDDQRLVRFVRQCHPQVCEEYNTMLCTAPNCAKLHVCNDYLCQRQCSATPSGECLRSHNRKDTHNARVFFRYGVLDMVYNRRLEHMLPSLIMRYVDSQNAPLSASPLYAPLSRQVAKVQPMNNLYGSRLRASPLTLSQTQAASTSGDMFAVAAVVNSRANIASPSTVKSSDSCATQMATREYAPLAPAEAGTGQRPPSNFRERVAMQNQQMLAGLKYISPTSKSLVPQPLLEVTIPNAPSPPPAPQPQAQAQPVRPMPSVIASVERGIAKLSVTVAGASDAAREGHSAAAAPRSGVQAQLASQRVEPSARTSPPLVPPPSVASEPKKAALRSQTQSQPAPPESSRTHSLPLQHPNPNLNQPQAPASEALYSKKTSDQPPAPRPVVAVSSPPPAPPPAAPADAAGVGAASGSKKKPFLCERHMREVCEHEATPGDCEFFHLDSPLSECGGGGGGGDGDGEGDGEGDGDRVVPLNYLWQYCVPAEFSQGEQFEHVAHMQRQSVTSDGWIAFDWEDNEAIERAYSDPSQRTWSKTFDIKATSYVFGGRSELQFEHATQVEACEAHGGAAHALKTRMKRMLVNTESKSFTFELAKPVFLDVRCVRAPSRGVLPANCSRAVHWRWFHQLPDDSWLDCEYLGADQIGEIESRYLANASIFRMKSPRRLRQSADEKGAAAGAAAGAGGKGRTLYTYVFNLETLLLDCIETGESFELARRPAFLPLVTRDADS